MKTCGRSQRKSLYDVAHGLDASVCNDGDPEASGVLGHFVHRGALGPATRHDCKKNTRPSAGTDSGDVPTHISTTYT